MDKNRALIAFSESPRSRYGKVSFDSISRPEQVFWCVWDLESDVNNGGFQQYFFNSTGDHAILAVEAMEAIGARRMAAVVREAVSLFPDSTPSPDRSIRQGQLEALSKTTLARLHDLTLEFLKYPDDLTDLLYDYVILHRSEIQGSESLLPKR